MYYNIAAEFRVSCQTGSIYQITNFRYYVFFHQDFYYMSTEHINHVYKVQRYSLLLCHLKYVFRM